MIQEKKLAQYLVVIMPILISIIALGLSGYAVYISYKQLQFSSRPYVFVENFGYLNKDNLLVQDIQSVLIKPLNSPSKILQGQFVYSLFQNGKLIKTLDSQGYPSYILYPTDGDQHTQTTGIDLISLLKNLGNGQEIRRSVSVSYKGLSDNKQYFFQGSWKLDPISKTWQVIDTNAD